MVQYASSVRTPTWRLGAYMGKDMQNVKVLRINRVEVKVAMKYVSWVPVIFMWMKLVLQQVYAHRVRFRVAL